MARSERTKWIATGKLSGIGAIVLLCFSILLIYFEGYQTYNGLSIIIIFFSFFLYLLYSSLLTWHTVTKPINFIDRSIDKETRISELNKRYMETKEKLSDFLKTRIIKFSESSQKRFGYSFTRFEIKEVKVTVIVKYPMNPTWINNSIEIRGGKFSDSELIIEIKQYIEDNIG